MKKTYLFLLTVFLLLNIITASAFGQQPTQRVNDYAGLITASQIQALEARIASLRESLGFDIVIVTTDSLDGKSATAYADDYFDYNGYGAGENYDGVLFLLAIKDRSWAISTSGRCITLLPQSTTDRMGEAITPYLSNGNYNKGFETFLDGVVRYSDSSPAVRGSSRSNQNIPYIAAIGASLVISIAIMMGLLAQMNTAKPKRSAMNFIVDGSFKVTRHADIFLWSHITKTPIPRETNSGGGGGHISSSGRSHGGSSGRF
ncbi:MAG: TPM domain-containing protein [Clostridiales bacterium]|jgi:uncharacterized protein|nr:TPM domain-containing protein [Clostridiales bacterium]